MDFTNKAFNNNYIRNVVNATLEFIKEKDQEITIAIVSNSIMESLNRDYRGESDSTDVLSFKFDIENPESGHNYLGDVIISGDKVLQQAENSEHSVESELTDLIIHGLLHLVGYDHAVESKKKIMFRLQKEINNFVLSEMNEKS